VQCVTVGRMTSAREPDVVEREPVAVMVRRVADELPVIQRTWAEVEDAIGLHGRHFFGAFDEATNEYLVCVRMEDGDDPSVFELEAGELPGGRFARLRLRGEPPAVYEQIASGFSQLLAAFAHDASRVQIEHYRRVDEIDLLLPIS
jgi:hypothetical protein